MAKTALVFVTLAILMFAVLALVSLPLIGGLGASSNGETSNTSTTSSTDANGTVSVSRTSGLWGFKASVNSTLVGIGGAVSLSERLTYLGNANTTIELVSPISSASLYNSTGAQVWQWTPSRITTVVTVYPGETLGDPICIPITAAMTGAEENLTHCFFPFWEEPVPGRYSVVAAPIFYSTTGEDLGQNLQVSLNFTVTS